MNAAQANNSSKLTKNERREAARNKAREIREKELQRHRRNKIFLQGGIVLGAIAVVIVITLVVLNTIRPAGPSPANMATNGIVLGVDKVAQTAPAREAAEPPAERKVDKDGPINIEIYSDYHCSYCMEFEKNNSEQLVTWMNAGAVTVEIHPISVLDRASQGAQYSTRAANAAACLANYSPNSFFDFNILMFNNRPEYQTNGLDDSQIKAIIQESGATNLEQINECIDELSYKPWVAEASKLAGQDPVLQGTQGFGAPTIVINGTRYPTETYGLGAAELAKFVGLTESTSAEDSQQEQAKTGSEKTESGN